MNSRVGVWVSLQRVKWKNYVNTGRDDSKTTKRETLNNRDHVTRITCLICSIVCVRGPLPTHPPIRHTYIHTQATGNPNTNTHTQHTCDVTTTVPLLCDPKRWDPQNENAKTRPRQDGGRACMRKENGDERVWGQWPRRESSTSSPSDSRPLLN